MARGESGSPKHSEHAGRDSAIGALTLGGRREIRKIKKPEACRKCPRRFAYIRDLERHLPVHERKEGIPTERFGCPHCGSTFTLKHNLTRHLNNIHKDIYPRGPAS